MNPDTLVAICCYGGDAHQVIKALPQYLHHECPTLVYSPEDAPADMRHPKVGSRLIGKVGYIGQVSLDRQLLHLHALLQHPAEYYLFHDSDSLCLSPKIPQYLYDEPDVLWSNVVNDDYRARPCHTDMPELAFQPPYFFSRRVLLKMIEAGPGIRLQEARPFIDHYMVQLAVKAKINYKGFPNGRSFPAWNSPGHPGADFMVRAVQNDGVVMVHAVKHIEVVQRLMAARKEYLRTNPSAREKN
jgi:hypothetical protein